ncbi:MAG: hypothetical protein A2V78_13345 [Betaproteobacteria bacterium RBG_16_64_18]|nr:MAG: hypothetical protein A2V78_13345 [Betaproteobacteria bacterium RBG_16_64_18]OGA44017.1 MAG: hypothetical protein A3G26_01100 [Betaproteobacteria bacterium RIFCSPLOWO2_12_FULL_65_110]
MVANVLRLAVEPWRCRARKPHRNNRDLVAVRIDWHKTDLLIAVKKADRIWRPRQTLWEVSWNAVRTLGNG